MASIHIIELLFILFIAQCGAIALPGAAITAVPAMTTDPFFPNRSSYSHPVVTPDVQLKKRQSIPDAIPDNFVGFVGPNNICGYHKYPQSDEIPFASSRERSLQAMRCQSDHTCAVRNMGGTDGPEPVCCAGGKCISFTTCVDEEDSTSLCPSSGCGDGTVVCREPYPYCGDFTLSGPWGPASRSGCFMYLYNIGGIYLTTSSGEETPIQWLTITAGFAISPAPSSSSSTSPLSSSSTSPKSPTPTGAIAGAVVGGLVVISITVCVLFLIYRKTRSEKNLLPEVPGRAELMSSSSPPTTISPVVVAHFSRNTGEGLPIAELERNEVSRAEMP